MYEILPERSFSKAFTIIEILVAISVMAILFTIGLANFRGNQRFKSLDAVRNQVVADLRQTQEYANAAKKSGCAGELLNVTMELSTNSYDIFADCRDSDEIIEDNVLIPAIYEMTYTDSSVIFLPVGGGVESAVTITIEDTVTHDTTTISVNQAGEIR